MQLNRKHRQKQKPKKNKKQKSKYGVQTDKSRKYYRQNRRRAVLELEILKTIIEKTLGKTMGTITEKTTFVDDLGADSLDIFQIIMGIEEEYDIELENEAVEQIQTVGDAIEALRAIK